MRYAKARCTITPKADNPNVIVIQGPYMDDPKRTRTVSVFKEDLEAYESGKKSFVQTAFPYLSPDDREFLISGISPETWDKEFSED